MFFKASKVILTWTHKKTSLHNRSANNVLKARQDNTMTVILCEDREELSPDALYWRLLLIFYKFFDTSTTKFLDFLSYQYNWGF